MFYNLLFNLNGVRIDCRIPRNIGVSIPMKATFFITYIMVDGWAAIACEILRFKHLVIFQLKNMFIVKTERDMEKAMNPGGVDFPETLPSLQLYFLLGIVYMVVTPILLPFILIFFAFAYFVYRHQVSSTNFLVLPFSILVTKPTWVNDTLLWCRWLMCITSNTRVLLRFGLMFMAAS